MRFAATFDANGVRKGAAEAVASMKSVSVETDKASASLRNVAKDAGHYYDALGHLHRADGKFASSAESAAVKAGTLTASVRKATDQTRALGSSSEKAGKQIQGFGSGSDSASKSLAKASSVADALNQRFASLTQRVLSVYAAYKLLDGVVAATNIGIQANAAWESQKLSIASIVSSTNQLADAQGRVLEGSEKFVASQQVAEKLMQRLQQLGLETTATTQELVNGFQAIIAPALKAGYALEEIPELATRAAQAMGAFQIPIQQMRTEVEALLSGNINKAQDLLAPYLNISKELVKEWKAQGVLVEEINNRLESFKYSGDAIANTWEGLVSNTKEYVEFISRGSTDGLFNSMKASISQLQQLLITFNKETGKPEISQNINNIREAYERLNNFIGDKILTATYAFSDALRNLNDADTLANLETTFSNVWDAVVSIGTGAGEAALEIGSIATAAIDGWNNLPDTIREIGLFGIALYGKKGVLALAGVAIANRFIQNTMKAIALVQSGELSNSEWASMTGDELEEWIKNYEKKQKQSIDAISGYSKDKNAEALMFIRNQYREQTASLEKELQEQQRLYDIYSQNAKNYDFDIYGREAAQEQADNIAQRIDAIKSKLNEVTDALHSINQEATSFDLEELFPTAPFSDATASLAGLLTTSRLFGQSLFTAKKAVNDLDGATAEVSFNLNFAGGAQNFLSGDPGEGTPFAIDAWRQATLGFFKEMQDGIRATSTLGKTAADDGKKKAKQIESALHSVESELNKLQMTDAQYRQWQVDEKVEKLEKLLGSTNPKVIELRTSLQKELNDNLFKDVLKFANPAAAAVATVEKEYDDWKKNLEQLKKQAPDKYAKLMAENINLMADAQRQYNNALEQAKSTFINFRKETADIYAQSTMTDEEYFVYQTNRQIEEWEKQGQSRADIDERVNALLLQRNNKYSADFGKMWEETYNRVDQAGADMLENFLSGTKNTFDSLKKMFIRTLAEMANAAWLRPITVQIMGTLGGVFGVGGTALAYDSATGKMVNASGGGGMGNLSGVSNLMPGSWFSGIGDTINNTMAGWFPGTFAMSGAAGTVMTPVVGAADIAGLKAAEAAMLGGNAGGGMAASGGTFLSTVSPYLMAGGLGSLGYTMLGGKLGLPQSKYSGLTAGLGAAAGWGLGGMAAGSAALAGTGMAAGATFGSVVPVVGTIIGAIAGGALGSLFGQERKTHPSVYGHMMDQGYTTDAQSYIDAFMEQATYDRAGKTEASAYAQVIGEAASQTAGNILNLAAMLPDEYKKSVEDQLESATWSAGRGYSGASWNLQNWKEGMAEERIQEAVDDMFEQMGYGANKAFADAGIGDLFDSFDLSTEEGFKKAQTAISAISSITTAIDEIKAPTSEAEQQAKAFVAQMDALGEAVKASGLNAAYADKMIGEYRTAYVDSYVKSLDEMFNPLSEIEQQAKSYKESIDSRVAALTTMSASEAQLAKVRGYTQKAIDSIVGSLDAAFFPLSDVEKQTKSTMELLTAYENALKTLGDTGNGLAKVDEARAKVQSDLLDKVRAYVSTTPEVVSQAAAMNAEFDALHESMLLAGNATAALEELERNRTQALAAMREEYLRSFDQSIAQRYGTLNGTSDAVSRAISQENELREAIQKFGEGSAQVAELLHVQAAENVYAAQAKVDALQEQLNQLKAQAIQAEISAINEQLSAAKTLKETWERLSKSLYDSRAKLWTSDADALGLFARRDAAQSEFDRLYTLTMQGDEEAAAKLASSGDTLLSLLKETSANGEQYTAGFWDVEQKLKDAESVAGKQLSEAQKSYNTLESQLKAQQSMLDALGYNNNSLDAINAQIVTVGNQLAKALGNLNAAQSNPNYGGTTSGGGYVSWEDKLLQEKADALNAGQTLAPGQTAGGWTPDKVLSAIKENGWTVADWYNYHGKAEGFAAGGLTPLNEMFSVGEAGKEYMLSPYQYVVLNNSMTRKLDEMQTLYRQTRQPVIDYRLMQMPVMGTDGDATAEIVKLREEVSELKNILRQTLTKTDTISANSGKIYRMAQKWDSDGLPATRTS